MKEYSKYKSQADLLAIRLRVKFYNSACSHHSSCLTSESNLKYLYIYETLGWLIVVLLIRKSFFSTIQVGK